ncbi:MAG: hypothetical protein KatS3mg105_5189 [Gemmatales bacterium]|nr:MAG: hypothetical protein KatS3mg105_5189 [Gemmatales bacterium]
MLPMMERFICPTGGYRVYQPDAAGKSKETYRGTRALPAVIASTPNGLLQIVPEAFWQQFPQAVEWNGRHLVWQPWADLAGEYDDRSERGDRSRCTELQGGEQKTWTIWFVSGDDPVRSVIDQPPLAVASAEYLVTTGTLWPFSSKPRLRPEAEQLLDELRHGPRCIEEKRERIDEYGWRHYGEWYADHEQRYYKGSEPLVSHYNNQYDLVYGLILHWLRTADPFFWDEAARLARHVIDIDIYHTTEDRPVYNGGLFWHTDHYVSAHTATHRTFSCKNAGNLGSRYGGGPGNEHNYTSGLLHYYFLTGDWTAREAVLGLADWVLAREDPNSTVLGLVAPRPTGRASSTTHGNYHGPGRGAGNSINALLDAWWLTQDSRYLRAAQELIRRTIHPDDDFHRLALDHIEHRWSYTVHLAVLLRYAYLLANDRPDESLYYVFKCLQHYGRWMLKNEKPYFDRESELEFPTETWGAHDIRKGNVLRLIGQWMGESEESRRMEERGEELIERGWYDLMRFDTRAATRPVAIVLQECLRQVSPVANYRPTELASVTNCDEALRWAGPFVGQRDWIKMQLRSPLGWARLLVNLCQITRWSKVRWGI